MKLDNIDRKILRILQSRGKITNVMLSKEIGLSPGPTLERVKRLEEQNLIIGYNATLNKTELGYGFTAFVQLTLVRQQQDAISNFLNAINNTPEIMECYQLTGAYDYQLKVVTKDIPAFEALVRDNISKIKSISHMQTMVVLKKVKDSHVLPEIE